MQTKTAAIVLKTVKYGDAKLIIDMLTEECGRIAFVQRVSQTRRGGGRAGRGAAQKGLFQPLTLLDIVFDYRPNAALQQLREAAISSPFVSLMFDERKLAIALFLTEFTYYATRTEQRNVPLYRFVQDSVLWLDACQSSFSNFHIVFMMGLTRYVGFFPNLIHNEGEDFFDLRDGCFRAQRPLHDDYVEPDEAAKIIILMRLRYATMHLLRLSHGERNRCIDIILNYYRLHVPNFPTLKSLEVVRELFA